MKATVATMCTVLLHTACFSARARTPDAEHDTLIFVEDKDEYLEALKKQTGQSADESSGKTRDLAIDFAGRDLPASPRDFKQAWHHPPVCQDITGSCWSFSATSFFESEIHRLTGRKIKLSEMYTVYWEYVEKARRFVRERGRLAFNRGSQPNAVPRIWRQYGVVPASAYQGRRAGQSFHNDKEAFAEMKAYLVSVKEQNAWNEEAVLATIRAILDHYMGEPPTIVTADGRSMTPPDYFREVVRLNLDDYVDVMSLMEKPFHQTCEYEVSDNWWHADQYMNLPLDEFIGVIRAATRAGYTVCLGGDTSEPGYSPRHDMAVIPTFDVPPQHIDDSARQLRFSNGSTSDDHAVHLVGYLEKDGRTWYLIKDSETRAQNGHHPGYMFYHEDYMKLKTMNLLAHKDVLQGVAIAQPVRVPRSPPTLGQSSAEQHQTRMVRGGPVEPGGGYDFKSVRHRPQGSSGPSQESN